MSIYFHNKKIEVYNYLYCAFFIICNHFKLSNEGLQDLHIYENKYLIICYNEDHSLHRN